MRDDRKVVKDVISAERVEGPVVKGAATAAAAEEGTRGACDGPAARRVEAASARGAGGETMAREAHSGGARDGPAFSPKEATKLACHPPTPALYKRNASDHDFLPRGLAENDGPDPTAAGYPAS